MQKHADVAKQQLVGMVLLFRITSFLAPDAIFA